MMEYGFEDKLAFSRGVSQETHPDTIRHLLGDSCVKVVEPSIELNKKGIDFVATLRRGAEINIDIKSRAIGCCRFWKTGPELSLEIWSVLPENDRPGKCGWSLDESKLTDYTLHVFAHSDCRDAFLLPFQLLRQAFRANYRSWTKQFPKATQSSGSWKSQCLFVPAGVVIEAIGRTMKYSSTLSNPDW